MKAVLRFDVMLLSVIKTKGAECYEIFTFIGFTSGKKST